MQQRQPPICKFGDKCIKFSQGACNFNHAIQSGGGGICKFGDKCNKFAQGVCTFNHAIQSGGGGGGGRMGGQGMNPMGPNPNLRGTRDHQRYFNNFPNNNQGNSQQGGGSQGWGTQHGNWGKDFNQPYNSQGVKNNPNYIPNTSMPLKADEFTSKFCMSYQFNQPCKFEEKGKCSRIHGFDEEGKIKRIIFSNEIPPEEPSKLGKFVKDNQTYLILRMGNGIAILIYNQETSQFANMQTWKFPKPQLNYYFFSQKQNFVYFATENPKNSLHEIFIYDILTGLTIPISQAHQGPVTDVIHFTNDIVLSSSKDGTIKVWKIQGNNAILDKASCDHLLQTYSTGKNIQILFLDLSLVNGMKVLSAGTNDNRILFFLGDQMQYTPLALTQQHAQAFKIRYCTLSGVTVAFVITWTLDNSSSSVIAVNLNDFKVSDVVSHSTKDNPRNNIYLIEVIQEKLFVVNLQGTVTIYSLPAINKVGLMLHKNPVNSIVSSEYVTKTNIVIPQMFVLQSKYHQKPGSIGVYTVKP